MARGNKFTKRDSRNSQQYDDDLEELGPVAQLLNWRDPRKSGIVFGTGLTILLSLTVFSVISVVAYTLLFTLLGTLSFRIYKNVLAAVNKTEGGNPFQEYLDVEIEPSQDRVNEVVEQLLRHGTCLVKRLRSVFLVQDIVDTLKFLLGFWALTYIGSWFNGLTLVILAFIGAFALPTVYRQNKAPIDHYLNLVSEKLEEVTDKIPFLKNTPKSSAAATAGSDDEKEE